MPTSTKTETGIGALAALSTVSSATRNTVLFRTLHLIYIAPLGLRSTSSWCCTPLRVRIPRTLLPLVEPRLFTDAKYVFMASMAGTCLILRPRTPNITKYSLLMVVFYLLDMYHQSGKVHIIMEHRRSTLFLQVSIDSFKESAHLIPDVLNQGCKLPG